MRDTAAFYTLTTPTGLSTLNPNNFNGPGIFVEATDFQSQIRQETVDRPQEHGAYMDAVHRSGGVWTASLLVGATGISNRIDAMDLLLSTLHGCYGERGVVEMALTATINGSPGADSSFMPTGTGCLQWIVPGGSEVRQLEGLRLIQDPIVSSAGGSVKRVQVMMGTEKPFALSKTIQIDDSTALTSSGSGFTIPLTIPFTLLSSGGGIVSTSGTGSFPWNYPVFQIFGPITNPIIRDLTENEQMSFVGSIADGDYWEVDTFAKTVLSNGQVPVNAFDISGGDWFKIDTVGASSIQLSGSSFNSSTKLRRKIREHWA